MSDKHLYADHAGDKTYIGCFLLLVGASFAGGAWALGRSQGWW